MGISQKALDIFAQDPTRAHTVLFNMLVHEACKIDFSNPPADAILLTECVFLTAGSTLARQGISLVQDPESIKTFSDALSSAVSQEIEKAAHDFRKGEIGKFQAVVRVAEAGLFAVAPAPPARH